MEKKTTLKRENINAWEGLKDLHPQIHSFGEGYKEFLDQGKTERMSIQRIIAMAEEEGFRSLDHYVDQGEKIGVGDKVYAQHKGKQVVLFRMGNMDPEQGFLMVGSHVDVPRLDVKQAPLYEDGKLAFLKTHYYGGVKKYQWVTLPLAIHGTVVRADGSQISISIGEEESDPVFFITDLLPHLSREMMEKKLSDAVEGEMLNVLVGSIPAEDKEEKERFKTNVLQLLHEKYGMVEEDFISAELEVVPAGKARDVGFDRSVIGAYGHDDRVCAYTSLKAIFDAENIGKSVFGLFVDKEEIGSVGDTSMSSRFFENVVYELLSCAMDGSVERVLRRALQRSKFLSADVNAAFDPNFPNTHDKRNAAYLGEGVVLTKYTGVRGKNSSNDAHAEFVGEIRRLFNQKKVPWQIGELGKVDMGGGGTIAFIPAELGMDVMDCGIGLLSMHSPWELASKADIYAMYLAFKTFYESDL
ncbi:aminopeptidase [Alkalibacter rhizosphaerae]|uniref:M18 family aminopeptidase n=1 Tax=Alkalibacter rhizosphaerae TaxID=2815577 RepID=A0A974XE27_9FIRM|nr:aminopeptidase [Alkalibacter rhizosphaerae]QSX07971.1 aminopeptidase [Alkalibacter rhizosphaerae]